MLLGSYTLAEQLFGVTPDARLLCIGNSDRTTLLWHLSQETLDTARSAFFFQSQCCPHVKNAFAELAIEDDGDSLVDTHEKLNKTLLPESDSTKPRAVTLDEAQNLAEPKPKSLRILSDFETLAETIDTAHMGRSLPVVLPSGKKLGDDLFSRVRSIPH
jgi:hypothetical protein